MSGNKIGKTGAKERYVNKLMQNVVNDYETCTRYMMTMYFPV